MRQFLLWLWLLSGLPVGLAMIFLPPQALLGCFTLFVLLETGHNFSPIALAWSHAAFRHQVIYRQPWKFIALPGAILGALLAIGTATQLGWTSWDRSLYGLTDWTNLLPVAVWIYWPWKIYHFGMQHFGVMQILGVGWGRRTNMILCLGLTFFGMAIVPALTESQWAFFLLMGVFSVNHWVVDIGLSARVIGKRWWLFVGGMLTLGTIGFMWIVPTSQGTMIRVIPLIIAARLASGFDHYLYSRWVWKLGDPQVRATIGKDLFGWNFK